MRLKKGDMVKLLTGKDAGRQGRVLKVLHDKRMVVVDSINVYKKHMKGDGKQKQSGIIDIAKPVDISNVMLVCPSCQKPSRVGFDLKDGEKTRMCKKCGKPGSSKWKTLIITLIRQFRTLNRFKEDAVPRIVRIV